MFNQYPLSLFFLIENGFLINHTSMVNLLEDLRTCIIYQLTINNITLYNCEIQVKYVIYAYIYTKIHN